MDSPHLLMKDKTELLACIKSLAETADVKLTDSLRLLAREVVERILTERVSGISSRAGTYDRRTHPIIIAPQSELARRISDGIRKIRKPLSDMLNYIRARVLEAIQTMTVKDLFELFENPASFLDRLPEIISSSNAKVLAGTRRAS